MNRPSENSDHLRFSSAILRLLGEELNPNPNQGIVELVKNSYDADASWCRVELEGEHLPKGTLRIRDNGDGMSAEDIRAAWLIVGESRKQNTGYSKLRKRLLVGSKGLGRLAALRLGERAVLVTRPREQTEIEHRLELDWTAYEGNVAVDSVPLVIETHPRELGADNGTDIEISGLHSPWTVSAIRKLARTLHLFSDPFANRSEHTTPANFSVTLKSEAFNQIVTEASADYWTHYDYHLEAGVDENGQGWANVRDSTDRVIFTAGHEDLADRRNEPYLVPLLSFELWEFKRDGKKFATTTITKNELGKWLDEFGGVHLYYRGVRVSPYGDEGNDWLDLNLARARSPEERPSTNNSIGRVRLDDPLALLVQKTDRQGFLENTALEHLRVFASDALAWMQKCRIRKRDFTKKAEKKQSQEKQEKTGGELEMAIKQLPSPQRAPIELAVKHHLHAVEGTISLLQQENQLYHTLGTIGTTAAAFAHQSEKPLDLIQQDAATLEFLLGDPTKPSFPTLSVESVHSIKRAAEALLAFTAVTLKLLEHEKRNRGRQRLHVLIEEIVALLKPYLDLRDTEVETDFQIENPVIYGSRAAIESIFTNLIINSLRALAREYHGNQCENDATKDRRILIKTRQLGDRVEVIFADSGPGILDISIDDIWITGRSTTPKGSGLGLCIVRDTVEDMGGTIRAEASGELGGAEFILEIPLRN